MVAANAAVRRSRIRLRAGVRDPVFRLPDGGGDGSGLGEPYGDGWGGDGLGNGFGSSQWCDVEHGGGSGSLVEPKWFLDSEDG